MSLKKIWNKVFNDRKNCKYYNQGFCLEKLEMLDIIQVSQPVEDTICKGICENFERRKENGNENK